MPDPIRPDSTECPPAAAAPAAVRGTMERGWAPAFLSRHGWAVALIALSALAFTAAITFGTFRLWAPEPVGVFYDYQARSLLHGHLDVPEAAIRDEAFIVHGRFYGYFGPTPALLRLPFAAAGVPVGRLTKLFMLADFLGALVAAYLILCDASRWSGRERPSRWAVGALLGAAGVGSPLFFLGARPMMYHEAIACGAVFALWSCWASLRQLRTPRRRWWLGALGCGVLAIQARGSVGFFALTLLGMVALWQLLRGIDPDGGRVASGQDRHPEPALVSARALRSPEPSHGGALSPAQDSRMPHSAGWGHSAHIMRPRIKAAAVGLLCIAGALTLNGVAWLKFRTFDPAPYQLSRPYLTAVDRYGHVGHRKFHVENLPWGFTAYFLLRNVRLTREFPFVAMADMNSAAGFPDAKIDLPDFTIGAPYSMPALLALATMGALVAAACERRARLPLALLWLAGLPMAVMLCGFIAVAQRYLGDFCPLLIGSAAFGVAALDRAGGWARRMLRGGVSVLVVASLLMSAALVFDYQADWGPSMPEAVRVRDRAVRERIDRVIGRVVP